ncbi:MAG: glutathione S-transferase N-terminal domain-containing protein [Alcanivoracaceae bacterium]|nr:glutathione S-transferase N-terminal domain-containing protein [Alcanivoracaceae bacterium]
MFIIRKIIGSIILTLNWLFSPKGIIRNEANQSEIDTQTTKLKLYQFNACPFCVKVRRAMKRMSLTIETRDAKNNEDYHNELAIEGGKIKVPCLKIESENGKNTWLYESSDIIHYLENKFL